MDPDKLERLRAAAKAYIDLLDDDEATAVFIDLREVASPLVPDSNELLRPLLDAASERDTGE